MKRYENMRIGKIIIAGILGAAAVFVLCAACGAAAVKGLLPEGMWKIAALICSALGAALAGILAGRGDAQLVRILAAAAVQLVCMACAHMVFYKDTPYKLLPVLLTVLLTGLALALLRVRSERKYAKKYRRYL